MKNKVLTVIFLGLTTVSLVGCSSVCYNDLAADARGYGEPVTESSNGELITNVYQGYTVLDVRETAGETDSDSRSYVSLVLEDVTTHERKYYCYGSDKDEKYRAIASFIAGDTVAYLGEDTFKLLDNNNNSINNAEDLESSDALSNSTSTQGE